MEYWVNRTKLSYQAEGLAVRGEDRVLLDNDDDLTRGTPWSDVGYTIQPLFDQDLFLTFQENTTSLLMSIWEQAGLKIPNDFSLEKYHNLVSDLEQHLKAVDLTKLIDVKNFPTPISVLENRISEIIGTKVIVRNPYDNQTVFHFRVIRPSSRDNNPLHRDVWLPDYKDCINLYIPVAGSNENSSLIVASGSHRWPESYVEKTLGGAKIDGVQFNVPAVMRILTPYEFIRPNPGENEVMIFSPYLIHGGSSNLNMDQTRISVEIRLWRK
jgi:hypothetical protein